MFHSKSFISILILLISHSALIGQEYDHILTGNLLPGMYSYNNESILITNNEENTTFAGILQTRGFVHIKPQNGFSVTILPIIPRDASLVLGSITNIGVKTGSGGGLNKIINVELFPNPTISTIQLKSTENIIGYKVYDSQGTQKIANSLLKSKQFSFNTNNLSPGIYHTTILLENGQTISKQFIKQ